MKPQNERKLYIYSLYAGIIGATFAILQYYSNPNKRIEEWLQRIYVEIVRLGASPQPVGGPIEPEGGSTQPKADTPRDAGTGQTFYANPSSDPSENPSIENFEQTNIKLTNDITLDDFGTLNVISERQVGIFIDSNSHSSISDTPPHNIISKQLSTGQHTIQIRSYKEDLNIPISITKNRATYLLINKKNIDVGLGNLITFKSKHAGSYWQIRMEDYTIKPIYSNSEGVRNITSMVEVSPGTHAFEARYQPNPSGRSYKDIALKFTVTLDQHLTIDLDSLLLSTGADFKLFNYGRDL